MTQIQSLQRLIDDMRHQQNSIKTSSDLQL